MRASGQKKSSTILHLDKHLQALGWETLEVTCPTLYATLDTEKATSDNDLEARKETEVMRATKYRKKDQVLMKLILWYCETLTLPVAIESWYRSVKEE